MKTNRVKLVEDPVAADVSRLHLPESQSGLTSAATVRKGTQTRQSPSSKFSVRCSMFDVRPRPPSILQLSSSILALLPLLPSATGADADAREEAADRVCRPAEVAPAQTCIRWSQLGARAGADCPGEDLGVVSTAEGARLRCVFQRLEGEATREGLWLTSTVAGEKQERFRVVAAAVGREAGAGAADWRSADPAGMPKAGGRPALLPAVGRVEVAAHTVRFIRPGVIEEYAVSPDGVRQDLVVRERPEGAGELRVQLEVTGAEVESAAYGARLVLENSGRKIAYSRLRVTDATGKELPATMDVAASRQSAAARQAEDGGGLPTRRYAALALLVDDTEAAYPVRIDPTFSDANWIRMNPSIPGASGVVSAAVVDGSGNLHIGGHFTVAGDVVANHIAKWDGNSWSALGSGMDGWVEALAVSGSDLYAGGRFTNVGAGRRPATPHHIPHRSALHSSSVVQRENRSKVTGPTRQAWHPAFQPSGTAALQRLGAATSGILSRNDSVQPRRTDRR